MAKPLNLLDKSIPTWKLVIMLAWPSIIEQLLHTAVNYVDTAMVGSIGTHATTSSSNNLPNTIKAFHNSFYTCLWVDCNRSFHHLNHY